MAFIVAASAVVLAYPIAYFLAFRAGARQGLLLILLLVPFWTSFLLRIMAWKVLLGSGGVVNSFLQYVRLIDEPLGFLLYNRGTVVVTLIYVWIPFV
jgi:spermidine/putrescine transport system permease protein